MFECSRIETNVEFVDISRLNVSHVVWKQNRRKKIFILFICIANKLQEKDQPPSEPPFSIVMATIIETAKSFEQSYTLKYRSVMTQMYTGHAICSLFFFW